jgi:hypothetical protein
MPPKNALFQATTSITRAAVSYRRHLPRWSRRCVTGIDARQTKWAAS